MDDLGGLHDVIPAGEPDPHARVRPLGFPFETRYAAQTVYRVTLQSYTEASTRRAFHDRQRLFARNLPPTPAGTRIDAEIWLDDHKKPQVACYVEGDTRRGGWRAAKRGRRSCSCGSRRWASKPKRSSRPTRRRAATLIDSLRSAACLGAAATESQDRAQAEGAVQLLQDNLEQLDAKMTANQEEHLSVDEKAQRRAMEWVPVFENEILPKFWDLLSADERAQAIEGLRAVRVMAQTGAPASSILSSLDEVKEQLFATEGGPLMRAWYCSYLLGMPERVVGRAAQPRAALPRRLARRRRRTAGGPRALHETLAEAEAALKRYRATNSVVDASPDLVVPRARGRDVVTEAGAVDVPGLRRGLPRGAGALLSL